VSLDQEIVELIHQVHTAADYLKGAVDSIASGKGQTGGPKEPQLVCRQDDPSWSKQGAPTPDGGATGAASEDLKTLSNDIAETFRYVSQRLQQIAELNSTTLPTAPEPQLVCRRTT
jgi:hypothetical protein